MRKLVLGAAIMLGVSSAVAAENAGGPVPVVVAEVARKSMADRIEALGTLKANESIEVTANVSETVVRVGFDDGQRVKKGDVLVEMMGAEEAAFRREAAATAREAMQQFDRAQQLAKSGASATAELDEARRVFETAKARLIAIESQMEDLVIVAPFDGIVGLRNISVGALVQPGEMITTLDDDSVMKLDFSVPSTFLPNVQPGTEIESTAAAFGSEVFKGQVTSVGSRIDPVTRSVVVRAKIPNPERRLKPGLLMKTQILSNPRDAIVVPEEAIVSDGDKKYVYVVDDSTEPQAVSKRIVETGTRTNGEVEIVAGLTVGERVVTRGAMALGDGAAVKITALDDGTKSLDALLEQSGKGS